MGRVKLVAALVGALSLAALVGLQLLPGGAWAPGEASLEAVDGPRAGRRIEIEPPHVAWGHTPARAFPRRASASAPRVERYVEEREALDARFR
jgi:hypothetical protein